MAIITQDSRIIVKGSNVADDIPTVAPSTDHTDGTWDELDLYKRELFINEEDSRIWMRTNSGIIELMTEEFLSNNHLDSRSESLRSYVYTTTTITISTINNEVVIAPTGTISHANAKNFTESGNGRKTYNASTTRNFFVAAMISGYNSSGSNVRYRINVMKNGSLVDGAYARMTANGYANSVTAIAIINLSENDYLEVGVVNETGTENFELHGYNLIAIPAE